MVHRAHFLSTMKIFRTELQDKPYADFLPNNHSLENFAVLLTGFDANDNSWGDMNFIPIL